MTTNAQRRSHAYLVRVFIPFALGYFLSYLFRVVNAVIAPDLVADVDLNAAELGLLTSAYFLTFAVFQLPLGILLDRFGPRKTEAALLLFAALGAFVFATSSTAAGLTIGRALIGMGVSACLMGAFKAFVLWFPRERLPLINGLQMAAGGLGALTGTAPVEAALEVTDWRGVFEGLAIATLAAAAVIYLVVPERKTETPTSSFRGQLRGVVEVFTSPTFWCITPWTVVCQATFLAIQSLWAGPWMRDVAGLDRSAIASRLALIAIAMIGGYVSLGALAAQLSNYGVRPMTVAVAGMTLFIVVQVGIVLEWTGAAIPLWLAFGFLGTTGIIPYAALSQSFPAHLAGRVITGVNLLVFLAAFASQWVIGIIINLWPTTPQGGYAPAGYQAAFLLMLGLQTVGLIWYFISRSKAR